MEPERSHDQALGAERAGQGELRRRRGRRNSDGVLREFESPAISDDVRSVVFQLTRRLDELTGELDRTRRRVIELETLTDEDSLVAALNRRGFRRELGRIISVIKRYQSRCGLLHVDVEGLKSINTSYGHEVGDAVLMALARRIRSQVRASDVVGRIAGDAFGVILLSAGQKDAMSKADLLATDLAKPLVTEEGLSVSVSVRTGATDIFADDTPGAALIRAAAAANRMDG
ncbi:GGDEF domain-containing protein [Microbaculum marinum]|uniref:GGDEF domain-containing protein n=1 Tax=Microbaculum marinum TaxID=1764581 RepID=A0AAW9RNX3_9HYPH